MIALTACDGERVLLGVRACERAAAPSAVWASLRRYREDARPSVKQGQILRWMERDVDCALERDAVQHWVERRWSLCGPPPVAAPAPAAKAGRRGAPSRKLVRLATLRERAGLLDDEEFADLLRDEGWFKPLSELTPAWVEIAIELLEERLGERYDVLPEQPLTADREAARVPVRAEEAAQARPRRVPEDRGRGGLHGDVRQADLRVGQPVDRAPRAAAAMIRPGLIREPEDSPRLDRGATKREAGGSRPWLAGPPARLAAEAGSSRRRRRASNSCSSPRP